MDNLESASAIDREIDLPALGSRIAKIRKAQRWSQRRLALQAGIRPERLSRLELGRTEPRLREVVSLARVLNHGLEALLFGPAAGAHEAAEAQAPAQEGSGS